MADIIQQRRDTAARWAQYNPILMEGEVGYVTDNPNQYKIGNGRDKWNDLPLRGYTGTITQDTGDDENAVMSQKAVTDKLSELGSKLESKHLILRSVSGIVGITDWKEGDYFFDPTNNTIRIVTFAWGGNVQTSEKVPFSKDVIYQCDGVLYTSDGETLLTVSKIATLASEIKYGDANLFDENSKGIAVGQIIDHINTDNNPPTLELVNYSGYNLSDFIHVSANERIFKTDFDSDGNLLFSFWGIIPVCLFDENKIPVSIIYNPKETGYIVIPNGISYFRFVYSANNKIVISKDNNVTEYIKFTGKDTYSVADKIEDLENEIDKNHEKTIEELSIVNEKIADLTGDGSQWRNKKWYAYGTSITETDNEYNTGKYAPFLAQFSGMILTNKGIGGAGIGDLGGYSKGQVRAAIMNTTDGKLEADLITLEVGANDTGASVSLGTIYDTDETTLCGCLNMCIRYLQENTNAQIVVFPSPATKTIPNAESKYYEAQLLFKQVCFINKCWWIDGATNLGYAKMVNNDKYVVDSIHQSELGGYIFAKAIWSQLKSIPTFDLTIS